MWMPTKTRFLGRRPSASSHISLIDAITDAGLTSNLKICLDAGDADSYDGTSQSWLDLSGNGHDFYRGVTSGSEASDPTFNGSVGGLSSAEYFSFDGGDNFIYDTTNETWMQDIHKDGAIYSILCCYYPITSGSICGTAGSSGTAIGFKFRVPSGDLLIDVQNGSGNASSASSTDGAVITNSAWNIGGLSYNEPAGSGGSFYYANGSYAQSDASDTFDGTYSSPSSSNAANTFAIGCSGGTGDRLTSGSRMAWFAVWAGTALSKANFDTLYAALKGRVGLS